MPQLQIIGREADPVAGQIADFGKSISDIILKKQALALTQRELQIKAKNAESEHEQVKLQRQSQLTKDLGEFIEDRNPTTKAARFKMLTNAYYGGDAKAAFQDLHEIEPSISEKLKLLSPPADEANEGQVNQAQVAKYNSEAALNERSAAMLNDVQGGGGQGANPGDTFSAGGYTRQLNPKVQGTEADTIAKVTAVEQALPQIKTMLGTDIFGKSSINRTVNQGLVESGSALATSQNPQLQEFQSYYNTLRQAALFDEAGKALTGTEKAESLRKLKLVGKSDQTILKDLTDLANKASTKKNLLTGGLYGANLPRQPMTPRDRAIQNLPASSGAQPTQQSSQPSSRFQIEEVE